MKKNLLCLLFFLFISFFLYGEIVEINHLDAINSYLKPNTLVIFDLDNTLMEPKQLLGSDQWGNHQIKKYQNMGLSKEEAIKKVQLEFIAIQYITKVVPVESNTPKLVKELQKNYTVMGLTGRGGELAAITVNQLGTIGIDLSLNTVSQEEVFFKNNITHFKLFPWALFHKGILFVAGMNKGEALFSLLDKFEYKPKRIIFVDDKKYYLIQLEAYCKEKNIPYVGLRYNVCDPKVKYFRSDIADKQYEYIKNIPSDEKVMKILSSTNQTKQDSCNCN